VSLRDLIRHTVQHNVDLEILRLRARTAELEAAHERRLAELLDIGREVVAKDDRIAALEAGLTGLLKACYALDSAASDFGPDRVWIEADEFKRLRLQLVRIVPLATQLGLVDPADLP
jgi:hypothetical protein